jgi:thioredoxin reductase (NADPH)
LQVKECDVLIIGAGPAGLTAGIYTAKAGLETIVLDGMSPSHLSIAQQIENYPGFVFPVSGKRLLEIFKAQAVHAGVNILKEEAIIFNLRKKPKQVYTRKRIINANCVIIAVGREYSEYKKIKGEERLYDKGIFTSALYDGSLVKGKKVVVYGQQPEAAEEAIMLCEIGCDVGWIFEDKINMIKRELLAKLRELNANIIPQAIVTEIVGKDKVERIIIEKEGRKKEIPAEAVFLIRPLPTSALLQKAKLRIKKNGDLIVDENQQTNIPGVFGCGDVTGGHLQVAVAVGEASIAAIEVIKLIKGNF